MQYLPYVLLMIITVYLGALAYYDCVQRRLPNILTITGALVVFVWKLGFGGLPLLISALAAALLAGAFLFIPFLVGAAGAGDVKMLFTCGAIVGWNFVLSMLFYVSLAGVLVSIVMLLTKKADPSRLKHFAQCLCNPCYDRKKGGEDLPDKRSESVRIPFGVAISLGTLTTIILA